MRRYTILLAAGLWLAGTPLFSGEEVWNRFRGPDGQGTSIQTGLPTSWSDEKNIQWRQKLPGAGSSSPIVAGNRIYLTCYSGYGIPGEDRGNMEDLTRHLLCLDLETGNQVWKVDVPAQLPETKYASFVDTHGYTSSTPICDAERIYCYFGTSGVYAFDHTGKQLWHRELGTGRSGWGTSGSPILYKDLLIVNASIESQKLFALDKATGEVRWTYEKVRDAWNTPTLYTPSSGPAQIILNDRTDLLAVDAESGKLLWKTKVGSSFFCSTAIVDGDIVYAMPKNDPVLAVRSVPSGADSLEAEIIWKTQGNADIASPVLHDGRLYWASNLLYCADAKTGKILSRTRYPDGGRVFASPLAADGKLYVTTRLKGTYVFSLEAQPKVLAHNILNAGQEDVVQASPVVAGQSLLIRSDAYLWRISEQSH